MKNKQFISILLLILIPILAFSQVSENWNDIDTTDISVTVDDKIDLYTNKDGLHLIVQESNQLTYYLFNPTGEEIRSSIRDNNVNENPKLNRIVGYEGKLYIIYKDDSRIKTQKSTDAGATWSTTAINEITMNSDTSNGLDAWTDVNGVHLVYSEYNNSNSDYKTWYQRNSFVSSNWIERYEVTDQDPGGFPSVTTSPGRKHVTFTSGDNQDPHLNRGISKTRDHYEDDWESSQEIWNDSNLSRVIATSSKLHVFYYHWVNNGGSSFLNHRLRDFSSTTWEPIKQLPPNNTGFSQIPIHMAVTNDDRLHVIYSLARYQIWDEGWDNNIFYVGNEIEFLSPGIAASSNDVYVVWISAIQASGPYIIKMRQRDFAPLIPIGLGRSIDDPRGDGHPRIDWNENQEADLDYYEIWKKIIGSSWTLYDTTSNDYYIDEAETGAMFLPFVNSVAISYKIKAVDLENNKSDYSSSVTFNVDGGTPEGPISYGTPDTKLIPDKFTLLQNYPNPFNPITTIQFGLPKAQQVKLTIFSIDGGQVTILIDDFMEEGYHEITWNGKNDSGNQSASGMYFYRIESGNFKDIRKMVLLR